MSSDLCNWLSTDHVITGAVYEVKIMTENCVKSKTILFEMLGIFACKITQTIQQLSEIVDKWFFYQPFVAAVCYLLILFNSSMSV